MNLEQLLAMLEGVDFENKDNFISGVNNLSAGAQARITELETANAEMAADLQKAQADNYKLILAQTAKQEEGSDEGEDEKKVEVTEEQKDVNKLIKD